MKCVWPLLRWSGRSTSAEWITCSVMHSGDADGVGDLAINRRDLFDWCNVTRSQFSSGGQEHHQWRTRSGDVDWTSDFGCIEEEEACKLVGITSYSELTGGRQGTASKLIESLRKKSSKK